MMKLNEITNKNPFKVPENYFEEANRIIISATSGYSVDDKKSSLFNRFKPFLLIAATITGIVFLSYSAIKLISPDKSKIELTEILNNDSSESYINDIDILTLEENASALALEGITPDVSSTDIIDYLLMENIDINDIYEQL